MADEDRNRACWVCFATDEDDREAGWVQPCRCKGTTKWVHQQCLQRWIDEKQRGNQSQRVSCPQCNTEYLILFPKYSTFVYVLDLVDRLLYRASPFLAAGVVLSSVYWTAVTYGAVTVMQVIGHREGLNVMEQADPLFLLVGLPTIPIMLVLGKMVRWDHYLLKLWWRHAGSLPGMKGIFSSLRGELPANTFVAPSEAAVQLLERPLFGDALSATRVLVSALFLPTAATFVGRFCFTHVQSQLHRTLLVEIMWSKFCRNASRRIAASATTADPQQKFGAMNVFDRRAKQRHREMWVANPNAEKYEYLRDEVGYRNSDRLFDIKRKLDLIVELGCGRGYIAQHLVEDVANEYVLCDMSDKIVDAARGNDRLKVTRRVVDEEQPLPFASNSVDAVVSSLSLHWVNNLPGLFHSVHDILKPDGVFLGSMYGNDTLYELRGALQTAETELEGGFGIHVSPFVEPSDLGGLLRNARFTMLTLDSDSIVVGYPGLRELMIDLKGMAENNCAWKRKTHLHRKTQQLAAEKYKTMYGNEKGDIRATFHVLSFIAWKPHESQPKPAKRGSATMSLKDLDKLSGPPMGTSS